MEDIVEKEDEEVRKVVQKYKDEYGERLEHMLLRMMKEHGLSQAELSRRARLDPRILSDIKHCRYKPSAETIGHYAIAMHLSQEEADKLLKSGGLAFTSTDPFDATLSACISLGIYDWGTIEKALEECGKIHQ